MRALLIWVFAGSSMTTLPFESMEQCEAWKAQLVQKMSQADARYSMYRLNLFCMPDPRK